MAATSSETSLICKTCGKEASARGHLCTPAPIKDAVDCNYCGKFVNEVWHTCRGTLNHADWVCRNCGRVAVESGSLCFPEKICD
jgi:DNA-directed RNA polymerase subunit RPC12/RpoP